MSASSDDELIISATRQWLEKAVIGLNLCPFAKAVHVKRQIRYAVSHATSIEALQEELRRELLFLQAADPASIDTSLLIHPWVLNDFFDYNDFLRSADKLLRSLRLSGQIQIASFHPAYQFADCEPDAIENYTNRSPYPMLHLLREASVEKAVAAFPDAEGIYERNIATMRRLGTDGWRALAIGDADDMGAGTNGGMDMSP
jgi:uncharacterized protein